MEVTPPLQHAHGTDCTVDDLGAEGDRRVSHAIDLQQRVDSLLLERLVLHHEHRQVHRREVALLIELEDWRARELLLYDARPHAVYNLRPARRQHLGLGTQQLLVLQLRASPG
eukprot:scaffold21907_cov57-Phaeocystis_antarctica.AAC.6